MLPFIEAQDEYKLEKEYKAGRYLKNIPQIAYLQHFQGKDNNGINKSEEVVGYFSEVQSKALS